MQVHAITRRLTIAVLAANHFGLITEGEIGIEASPGVIVVTLAVTAVASQIGTSHHDRTSMPSDVPTES